tara:strand:+ start:1154 stop:2335 length:1182 start_codon:yes stop_codon:yes gene_type:complete
MKKKIAILGSTGSIGRSTVSVIRKNKKDFDVILLSTNKNIKEISKQIKLLKPKNLIITDHNKYLKFLKKNKNKKIKIFNNYKNFNKIFKCKIDYTMSALSSFNGLQPTLDIIKFTKVIAIANKEAIICGWNLIKKNLTKYKTNFIPVDSEHFSIWSLIKNNNNKIDKVYITASGGPFLNIKKSRLIKIKPKDAIKHPNWSMGKKISIDSATLVNKIFEIIEAKKIFNLNMNDFEILLHPDSYVHAIVKFKNGLTKILIHDTDMKIPIFNSIYYNTNKTIASTPLNFKKINNLKLENVNIKQFETVGILKYLSNNKDTLYETVLVSANDQLVDLFLNKKINFLDISKKLIMIMKLEEFKKLRSRKPLNFNQISNLNKYVRLKTRTLCVRSVHNE